MGGTNMPLLIPASSVPTGRGRPTLLLQAPQCAAPPPSLSLSNPQPSPLLQCYVVHLTAVDPRNAATSSTGMAPLAIGFAVFLGHAVLIPLDGCSINPARSFGPALVANRWTDYW